MTELQENSGTLVGFNAWLRDLFPGTSSLNTTQDTAPDSSSTAPLASGSGSTGPEPVPENAHDNAAQLSPSDRIKKRRANTLAARRYRQSRLDKMAALEAALATAEAERDALKVQLAKVEGENATLRAVLGGRLATNC